MNFIWLSLKETHLKDELMQALFLVKDILNAKQGINILKIIYLIVIIYLI